MTIYYEVSRVNALTFIKSQSELNNDIKYINLTASTELNDILNQIKNISDSTVNFLIDAESPIFNDIEFSINNEKVKTNSESLKQDVMSGISLGSSTLLDAIAEDKFVIMPGRKTANLKNNLNQNHECIDAIANNGLMGSPKSMINYNLGKILLEISNNKKIENMTFNIIHSSLKVNKLTSGGISLYNIPRYSVGDGEILSVFFRYIALLFFPYMVVYNTNDIDYKYDI